MPKQVKNTNGHSRLSPLEFIRMVKNDQTTLSRAALISSLTGELPPINIEKECRYKHTLTMDDYQRLYDREGVATRVVSIYPEESWQTPPDIYETEDMKKTTAFEVALEEMKNNLNIFTHLQTADEISGVSEYGVVLLGFDDGNPLSTAVFSYRSNGRIDTRFKNRKLLYLRAIPQRHAAIRTFETNPASPRYGLPNSYSIGLISPDSLAGQQIPEGLPDNLKDQEVHWTRVLHLADNRKGSDVWGVPRLQPVFNRIFDLQKVLGGNGQGFWQGGFPGISIENMPGISEELEWDKESTKDEVEKYLLGLQRYLALENLTARPLSVQVADPKASFEMHLRCISMAIGVPLRVFMGSEEAKLASSQDMRTWNKRLSKRQQFYIDPFIIRPFLERMFIVGALPRPKNLIIKWPDLNAPTENDRATTAQKITESLVKYVSGNVFLILPPREYLVDVIGFPLVKVEAILKSAGVQKMMSMLDKMAKAATAPPQTTGGGAVQKKKSQAKTKKAPVDSGAGQSA